MLSVFSQQTVQQVEVLVLECAKLRASRAFVPFLSHVPTCLRASVPLLSTCLPFLRTLCAFLFYVTYVASIFYVPCVPSFFHVQ